MELTQLSYSPTMVSFKKCLKSAQEARAQIDTTVTVAVCVHDLHPLFSNYCADCYSSKLPEKHSSNNGQGSFFFHRA